MSNSGVSVVDGDRLSSGRGVSTAASYNDEEYDRHRLYRLVHTIHTILVITPAPTLALVHLRYYRESDKDEVVSIRFLTTLLTIRRS